MMTTQENQSSRSPKKSYCSSLDTIGLLEYVREHPPPHYRFKVGSFSKLCEALRESDIHHFESSIFWSCGLQWMLRIYPSGKKSENGDGHISLYLNLFSELKAGKEIFATIKFFIYDRLRDVYLTIHDTKMRRFDAVITQRGIPRVMDLTTFMDPANGFVIDDCCVFGVEVSALPDDKRRSSSLYTATTLLDIDDTYVWEVEKVSELKEEQPASSSVFRLGGCYWMLEMCPGDKRSSLSVLFHDEDPETKKPFAMFELCLKDELSGNHKKVIASQWFSEETSRWSCLDFVSLRELSDPSNGYKQNDTITIEFKIIQIFIVEGTQMPDDDE